MKRSGPIQRKTPLRSGGNLQRKTGLRPVSKQRQKLNRERSKMVKEELSKRERCEAGPKITEFLADYYSPDAAFWYDQKTPCYMRASELHEPLRRSQGGSIVDPDNTVAICRRCHDWVHANPDDALRCGLLVSGYGVPDQDET